MKRTVVGLGEVLWDLLPEDGNSAARLRILRISPAYSEITGLSRAPLAKTNRGAKRARHFSGSAFPQRTFNSIVGIRLAP